MSDNDKKNSLEPINDDLVKDESVGDDNAPIEGQADVVPDDFQPEEPKESKTEKPKGRGKGLLVAFFVLLIALGCAAYGGYWLWQQMGNAAQVQNEQVEELTKQLDQLATELSDLKAQSNENTGWQRAVVELEDLVTASAQRWNRQANRTDERWPLEEALTLARLAQQRLQLDASADVAVGLLNAADEVLSAQDQAAVLPLRRQLASDVLALESVAAADINGHFFDLEAISEQIKTLTWVPKPIRQTPIEDDQTPAQGFMHELKQIVVIQRLDVPLEAPTLQSDFETWRQHTLLLLEQVQLALLARNQSLFDAGLEQAQSQLSQMASQFDLTALNSALAELSGSVLNPSWPNIAESAEIIERYLAEEPVTSQEGDS